MAMAERRAQVVWQGDLSNGRGRVTVGSGAFSEFEITWASRTQRSEGKTSPEELIAAAHGGCFSMALSAELTEAGLTPESLEVQATVSLDEVDGVPTVVSSALTVNARARGLTPEQLREAAEKAKEGCPVSRALKGNIEISVSALVVE
ncbi:MAG: OsmC family protein [Thermoleophilia bacterium]